jgi:hypothetical protein
VETAITRDQVDASNLICFEQLERRRQFVEETHRQRREAEQFNKNGKPTSASAIAERAFSGTYSQVGGAVICPALVEFAAKRAHEESELLRQQRKALEAHTAAPKRQGKS